MLRPAKPSALKQGLGSDRAARRIATFPRRLLPERLRTARGILLGVAISLLLWLALAALALFWFR